MITLTIFSESSSFLSWSSKPDRCHCRKSSYQLWRSQKKLIVLDWSKAVYYQLEYPANYYINWYALCTFCQLAWFKQICIKKYTWRYLETWKSNSLVSARDLRSRVIYLWPLITTSRSLLFLFLQLFRFFNITLRRPD